MIVWGFFSAMGWMTANWAVDKYFPEKQKEQTQVVQQEKKEDKPVTTSP
jgi:hypothetical protein